MLLLTAALLLAVSTSCTAWYFIRAQGSRLSLSSRIAVMPKNFSFPYALGQAVVQGQSDAENSMNLDESYASKLSRELYLAGFRSKKNVRYFRWISRFAYIIPAIILLIGVAFNSLSLSLFIRLAVIAGGFTYVIRFFIKIRRNKITREISRTLPQVLDLLIVSLEAGLNFTAALPRVLNELAPEDFLVKELRLMHHEYLGGLSFTAVCDRVSRRCELNDLSVVMAAVAESESSGASLAHVLRIHSHELRDKHRQRLREKAHKLPVKLIFPMMLIFLTIFTIALGPSVYRMKQQTKTFGTAALKSPGQVNV